MFETEAFASWGDMDFNSHMRNTAYLDKSVDARMLYLTSQGFSMSALMQLRIGPVVMRDEIEYFREIYLLERVSVNLALAGLSADGSRMLLRNEFLRGDQMVARVTSSVGWLDLEKRRLTCPPSQLFDAMNALERTEQFVELPSCVKATRSS